MFMLQICFKIYCKIYQTLSVNVFFFTNQTKEKERFYKVTYNLKDDLKFTTCKTVTEHFKYFQKIACFIISLNI